MWKAPREAQRGVASSCLARAAGGGRGLWSHPARWPAGTGRISRGQWWPASAFSFSPSTTLNVHQEVDKMETVWRTQEGSIQGSSGEALGSGLLVTGTGTVGSSGP